MFDDSKSPYSTGMNTDQIQHHMPTHGQERKNKDEWKKRKAQKTLPHNLQYVPDLIAVMVENGIEASNIIAQEVQKGKNQNDPEMTKYLENLEKIIDYLIKNTDKTLNKTSI